MSMVAELPTQGGDQPGSSFCFQEAGAQRLRGWPGGTALNGRDKSLHK